MSETLLAPPSSAWATFTSLRRAGPNRDWAPFTGTSGGYTVVDGIAEDAPFLVARYEAGDQEDVETTDQIIANAAFSRTMRADEDEETSYPPVWDGTTTQAGAGIRVQYGTANAAELGFINNRLDVYKATWFLDVPDGAVVSGMSLRMNPSQISPGPPYIGASAGGGVEVAPGGYANYTEPRSYYCEGTDTTTNWTANLFDAELEDPRLETWSAEWNTNHSATTTGDHKAGTAGDALSEMPVDVTDLEATYDDGDGGIIVPLSNWESRVEDGVISLIFSLDDTPTSQVQDMYVAILLGTYNSAEFNAASIACGTDPGEVQINPGRVGTFGGLSFGSVQLVIDLEAPVDVPKSLSDYEIDERGIVYFDLTEAPEGTPTSVDLLFFMVYAWTNDTGSTVYTVPIDPTNPSHEGPMPISIAEHHPTGMEDKTARAIWSEVVSGLGLSEPTLFEVSIDPTFIEGLEEVGFQFAVDPVLFDPYTYTDLGIFTDISAGGEGSPYYGPRLRLTYADGAVLLVPLPMQIGIHMRAALKVNRAATGEATFQLEADGTASIDPDRRMLDHRARKMRGY